MIRPPKLIGKPGRQLWRDVHELFELEAWQIPMLVAACTALDRLTLAQEALATDGLLVEDRFGQRRAHPAAAVARDASATMRSALRELGFEQPVVR